MVVDNRHTVLNSNQIIPQQLLDFFDESDANNQHCPALKFIKIGMWRIPNPTESGTFSEIRNPTDT